MKEEICIFSSLHHFPSLSQVLHPPHRPLKLLRGRPLFLRSSIIKSIILRDHLSSVILFTCHMMINLHLLNFSNVPHLWSINGNTLDYAIFGGNCWAVRLRKQYYFLKMQGSQSNQHHPLDTLWSIWPCNVLFLFLNCYLLFLLTFCKELLLVLFHFFFVIKYIGVFLWHFI